MKEECMPAAAAVVKPPAALASEKARLLDIIKRKSLLTEGGPFKLASGALSDYYLDLKPTMFDPEGAALIGEIINGMLAGDRDVDAIGGLELGAVPIVVAVSALSGRWRPIKSFVVRKESRTTAPPRRSTAISPLTPPSCWLRM
jgi:orotate phosphoribosyltransferase